MPTSRQTAQQRPAKKLGTRAQPEQTKAAILDAAAGEFSREGLAGARTDSIAQAAGVNKALLYYYFHDKESLYGAVLDRVFTGLSLRINEALDQPLPPRERFLAYAGAHFDYIAGNLQYPRLMSRELMRARLEKAGPAQKNIRRLVMTYFQPVFRRVTALIEEGIATGDFRPVNSLHFMLTVVASIVFYFTATPVLQTVTGIDPLTPERMAERRAAVLDFISAALFKQSQGSSEAKSPPVRVAQGKLPPKEGARGAHATKRSRA